jgi:hypothetical protein
MKKLLLLIFIVSPMYIMAQPTINANGVHFMPGDIGFNTNATQFEVPEPGANVTWDYSDFVSLGIFSSSNENYNGIDFPTANFRSYNDVASTYYQQTGSGIYVVGFQVTQPGNTIVFDYSNAETRLPLPFSYQSSVSDVFNCSFVSGVPFEREGSSTFTGHGYGTVILPTGTVTDVLCVKWVQEYADDSGLGFALSYSREGYAFYKNGFHYPILNLDAFDSGLLTYTNSWIDSESLNVIENSTVGETFIMFPNPAGSVLNLKVFDNQSTVNIFDVNGRNVYAAQSNLLTETIDLSSFDSGIYFVNVVSSSGVSSTEKLVVNRN